MKTSKYNQLKELVNAPFKVSGIQNNSQKQRMFLELLQTGKTHTCYERGSRSWTTLVDLTKNISQSLEAWGIKYEIKNDAPRGGKLGTYIQITMPAFLKEVAKVQKKLAEIREQVRKEQEKIEEIRRAHREWVAEQAKNFDLEQYRDEIQSMIICENRTNEKLSRKERGHITWELTHAHKGINAEVLNVALESFIIK